MTETIIIATRKQPIVDLRLIKINREHHTVDLITGGRETYEAMNCFFIRDYLFACKIALR